VLAHCAIIPLFTDVLFTLQNSITVLLCLVLSYVCGVFKTKNNTLLVLPPQKAVECWGYVFSVRCSLLHLDILSAITVNRSTSQLIATEKT